MILVLALAVGVLYATGAYLMMQRSLTRIVIGLALIGHGANLLLLVAGGRAGQAPFADASGPIADPLPQALALTAIVITFAVSAFLLALAYRSWQLSRNDVVEDDLEDRRISRIARGERAEAERRELEAARDTGDDEP